MEKGGLTKRDDETGKVVEVHCTYDVDSLSGSGTEASKRKVKGTLHWVSIKHAINAEVRLYDRLFIDEAPDSHKDKDFLELINPNSLTIIENAFLEPSLKDVKVGDNFQFQRLGYFNVDEDSSSEHLVFNRTVALKDSWAKKENKNQNKQSAKLDSNITDIMTFAGKYLKAREEDVRINSITNIFELSKKVSFESLLNLIKSVNSNKDYLAYLMILNSGSSSTQKPSTVKSDLPSNTKLFGIIMLSFLYVKST